LTRAGVTLVVMLIIATAGGCALKAPPTHDAVVDQALPTSTTIPATWQAAAVDAPVANDWLKSLNDPALDALVAEALANNRELLQASQNVTIAQQAVIVVGSKLVPHVGASVGGRSTKDETHDGTFNSASAFAVVGWEIDVWGKLRAQRAAAEAGYQATALEYSFARQSLAATVAKAWYLTIETRQLVLVSEQSVLVYSALLDLVVIRRNAGKDSDLDVFDVRASLDSARSDLEQARQSHDEARRALEQLLGRYPAAQIEAAAIYPPLPPAPGSGVPATLLERRPDIVAAEREVLAAFREEEAARLALLPTFSLSLIGGWLGEPLLSVLKLNPWLVSAAVGVGVPIYEGGALRAQVRIATARQAQAVANYGDHVLTAFREVENALGNDRILARRLPYAESAVRDRNQAVRVATEQYTAGARDLLWVSNLQAHALATEADFVRLRALQRVNRIRLHLALGGSFDATPAKTIR